jgi:hypothetical protein
LVDCSVHVAPHPGDLDVRLVHEPSIADTVPARSSSLDDQRGEALHPPVDGDVINLHAAFREQFFNISARESVAEVPADGQQDHVRREPVAGERSGHRTAAANHPGTLQLAPDRSTQQCPQKANNRIECDHGRLKARLRPMRGLRTDRTASTVIRGHAFVQNVRRGHYELGVEARHVRLRVAAAFDELAEAV